MRKVGFNCGPKGSSRRRLALAADSRQVRVALVALRPLEGLRAAEVSRGQGWEGWPSCGSPGPGNRETSAASRFQFSPRPLVTV